MPTAVAENTHPATELAVDAPTEHAHEARDEQAHRTQKPLAGGELIGRTRHRDGDLIAGHGE